MGCVVAGCGRLAWLTRPHRLPPHPTQPAPLPPPQLAVVVVGFPATPLLLSRCRFCISAGHTREDLDDALEKIAAISKLIRIRYRRSMIG